MIDTCTIDVTQNDIDAFSKCEAVVIREYDRDGGSRMGKVIAWGDADEMQDLANTPGIYIVPVGLHIVCDVMKLVSDLLPPKEQTRQ